VHHLADTIDPVLRPILDDWLIRSGALSALPGAPVVPDEPRRRLRLRLRRPRLALAAPAAARRRARPAATCHS
jgi:hypothetical protein